MTARNAQTYPGEDSVTRTLRMMTDANLRKVHAEAMAEKTRGGPEDGDHELSAFLYGLLMAEMKARGIEHG